MELEATADDVGFLRDNFGAVSTIAPFVRTVVLSPSKYDVDLDQNSFEQIRSFDQGSLYNELVATACETTPLYDADLDEWLSVTTPEAGKVFEVYHNRALADRNVLSNGTLEDLWTTLFREFKPSVHLKLLGFIGHNPFFDPGADSSCMNTCRSDRVILRHSSLSTYDNYLQAVVASLGSAKTKVRRITLDCELLLAFSGWDKSTWDQLRLDNLRRLTLIAPETWGRPDWGQADFDEADWDDSDWDETDWGGEDVPDHHNRDDRISSAMDHILAKCPPGLEHFGFVRSVNYPTVLLPTFLDHGLQSIRSLHLETIVVHNAALVKDISKMPALRSIYMRNCKSRLSDWTSIYQACFRHANRVSLDMDECWHDD